MDPQYLRDIADSAVFGTPVAFLKKYPNIDHYQEILTHQRQFLQLLYAIIQNEAVENGMDINQILSHSGFEEEDHKAIGAIIKSMYSTYKKDLIKKEICQGSHHLSCFNWRLKVKIPISKSVLGCSEFTHKQKLLLQIQFTISQQVENEPAQVINLELGIHQARQLLMQLKKIRKDLREGVF